MNMKVINMFFVIPLLLAIPLGIAAYYGSLELLVVDEVIQAERPFYWPHGSTISSSESETFSVEVTNSTLFVIFQEETGESISAHREGEKFVIREVLSGDWNLQFHDAEATVSAAVRMRSDETEDRFRGIIAGVLTVLLTFCVWIGLLSLGQFSASTESAA